jgi:hypothetical protein
MMHDQTVLRSYTTLINLNPTTHREGAKQRERERKRSSSYHHYSSLTPSGGLRATNRGTLDDRDSKSRRVRVQRVSISSFVRSAFYPDPSNSNLDSSSRKYDKTAVSASRTPTGPH